MILIGAALEVQLLRLELGLSLMCLLDTKYDCSDYVVQSHPSLACGNSILMSSRKAIHQRTLMLTAFGQTDPPNLLRLWYLLPKENL
jgi:hypothetical protein